MGIRVDIYRSDYDSDLNDFHGFKTVVVTNVDGPFEPTLDEPAAAIVRGPGGDLIVVSEMLSTVDGPPPMFGGTYAASSDSRWQAAAGGHPLRIHDRRETWAQYQTFSR